MDFYNLSASNNEANDLNRALDDLRTFHEVSKILTPVIISILLFIGLLGNSLVIYISVATQRIIKHPVHSILVLNLAVADLIYLLVSAPYQAVYFTVPGWIYGAFLCPALHYFSTLTMAVSIFTMCSLALMRFIAIMLPFKVNTSFITASGRLTGFLIITIVWILASILALPNLMYFELKNISLNNSDSTKCILECRWDNKEAHNINVILLLVITYVIPFLLVTVLYFFIGREVFCYMRKNTVVSVGDQSERKEYLKTTVMVFCLIIAFLVCWFPHHLYTMIMMSQIYKNVQYAVTRVIMNLVGFCFSYAHACVNPFIYTFAAPGFRKSLRKTLKTDPASHIYMKTWPRNKKGSKYSFGRPNSQNNIRNKVLESPNSYQETSTTVFSKLAMSVKREVSSNDRKNLEKALQATKKENNSADTE